MSTGNASTEENLHRLRMVITDLLGPEGCPWDRKQTPDTLCDYLVEECFELVHAVRSQEPGDVREELGDLFFLLLFLAELYERSGKFTLSETFSLNADKMIRRHPHVFGNCTVDSQEQVLRNWERIKRQEKTAINPGLFDSLPPGLPPLLKAYRIHSKAARAGFTWENDQDVEVQLRMEWDEWLRSRGEGDHAACEEEFGDYLFTLAEYARRQNIKPNAALDKANNKFLRRFRAMERLARERGESLDRMSFARMDDLWNEVKASEPEGSLSPSGRSASEDT